MNRVDDLIRARFWHWYPERERTDLGIELTGGRDAKGVRVGFHSVTLDDDVPVRIVSKEYHDTGWSAQAPRPRLGLDTDREAKPCAEFEGLRTLHAAVDPDDPQITSIRPLEFDPTARLLVMEHLPSTPLRDHLADPLPTVCGPFERAGAALAMAHRLEASGDARRRSVEEIDVAFDSLLEFVAEARGRPPRWMNRARAWWSRADREPGPIAPGHGDCSPRNALMADDGRVAWIDGMFRTPVPVLEDVATFTTNTRVSLRLNRSRFADRRRRARLADGFVTGYQERADLPVASLPAFEVLVLLDRQASILNSPQSLRSRALVVATDLELSALVRDDR